VCADTTVPDLQADVPHRELDDVLEDMREGKEGEECVLLGCEDVAHERLDGAHCRDEVCLGEHDALGCAGCARGVHNARELLCLWTAFFMLWLALAELAQLVLQEHLDFALWDGCLDLLDDVCGWLSIVNNDFDGRCVGENASTTGSSSALVKTPTQPGSLSEWVRPDLPRVSYAVAMIIPTDIQACCMWV